MKKILGLDLGTNSIGWALIQQDFDAKKGEILGMGSRIIPMTQDVLDIFSGGKPLETQTAARTSYRSVRRLRERHLLRRERLHRVLNVLDFLPEHYARAVDFTQHYGQFVAESEPKLTYHNRNFIFKSSFEEMLNDFKQSQPQLFYTKPNGEETKIPYDWTIYYLRKKALSQKIAKEELAWIVLNFNQKRGYYQLRGEEETENPNKLVEFHSLKIVDVVADEKPNSKGDLWYSLYLENGWIYRRSSKTSLFDWKDKIRDFIVTTDLNDNGTIKTDKEGNERRSFRAPSEDDWTLLKKKTEQEINKLDKTVGVYIYENLLQNPSQKIRGKLVRTIERKFYKDELIAILKKQIELQPELFTEDLYNDCVRELYRNNEAQQLSLSKRDFVHLLVEDIIFYQRPLRSQKSSIGNCTLEKHPTKDKNGNIIRDEKGKPVLVPLKVIPKSHPLYQEFRVWQWLSNLKIYHKEDDIDVTTQFIKTNEDKVALFEFLMMQKEVGHKDILKHLLLPILKEQYPSAKAAAFNKEVDKEIAKYRWNYVFDDSKEKEEDKSKKYPCNSTGYEIRRRLEKVANVPDDFLTPGIEQHLWHIIYSVTDKKEYLSALGKFADKNSLDKESFVANFEKFPPFKSEYGAFSEKAIKRFLPLLRVGKYWDWEAIDVKTQDRIGKILTSECDENIKERVREKAISLNDESHFQGLPIWLASYVIYDRHSEADIAGKWDSIADLEKYLEDFKQHSLRNPIVEQIVTETLRVVRDIWKQYGHGAKDFFNEIHVELGRDMKNTSEERQRLTNIVSGNEATNLRIKALLMELKDNSDGKLLVDNVRPYSSIQQDTLRLYEDGVLNSKIDLPDDIVKISKTAQPSKTELQRYKLWLEQKYRSPYTGQMIPLGRLFTEDYQIEHVIPKSRYFDDSFNNKIICEAAVNQLKDKQLGFEFIKNHHGEKVECGMGKVVEILSEEAYQSFVKEHYAKSKVKRQNLLLEDIPEQMITRQLNDTRYISKFISSLLSNIVREDKEDDGINSKNLIPGNGKITTVLKKDWGLDAVWNDLILPRFQRMNQLTNSEAFTYWNEQYQKFLPVDYSPTDSKRIEKKRIDHRHHAMDALVIACMTRDHVNLLNNQSAKSETSRYDLQNKLRTKSKETWIDRKTHEQVERDVFKEFKKPWDSFTVDARNSLETIVVSFKQNLRVINKATNNYEKWIEKDGRKVKAKVKQEGTNWAIRKPMHKETVSGKVDLTSVKVSKGKILTATRKSVDNTFDLKTIDAITDTGIQKILKSYLAYKGNNPEIAFSPEGLEEMNANVKQYNDGKSHQPIRKVRIFELGSKFSLGETGNKKDKFVEAAKGTNLYFAIYESKDGKRSYDSIPLNIVIERLKQSLPPVELKGEKDFYLTPNDLVYVPNEDEKINIKNLNPREFGEEQRKNIYKVVSFTGNRLSCIPHSVATPIVNKLEYTQLNKIEFTKEKESIVKLKVDRLGNISL
ncbi:MAG: type II CRISPR RNA-guided endonuclease Cas9 [Hungatella sp.]|nr:type II CRISPR RNA-guided endonuclease Cas9 [Hungatella sp.]MTK06597.1 type II CRISPR RNA-guided endonuclease Cas9 [Hungatella sp.]